MIFIYNYFYSVSSDRSQRFRFHFWCMVLAGHFESLDRDCDLVLVADSKRPYCLPHIDQLLFLHFHRILVGSVQHFQKILQSSLLGGNKR